MPALSELSQLFTPTIDGIYQLQLNNPLPINSQEHHLMVEIYDNQGNVKRSNVRFIVSDLIFSNDFD